MKCRSIQLLFLCLASSWVVAQISGSNHSRESVLRAKPLVILDEDLHLTISGKDNVPWAFVINRKTKYMIADEAGLAHFRKMTLPENFDPTFVPHAPAVKRLGEYYSGYKVEAYAAKVVRSGVKPFEPKVRKKINEIESFNIDYLYRFSQNEFSVEGLKVGDEVEITYQVLIPFSENYSRFASYRLFFHDDIPKLKYRFTLSHHETLDINLYQKNGAQTSHVRTENHFIHRTWEYNDLPGCIHEAGSRPYLELPHLAWVINYYRYYVHNSIPLLTVPHYAVIASLRSPELIEILNAIQIGSNTQEYAPFNRKYNAMIAGQSEDHKAIHGMHRTIVDQFTYISDIEYYRRNDLRTERLGEFFENGMLRDRSRYNLYYAIFARANFKFFTAFPIDKRFGEISDEYFQPNFDSDFLLATYFGEKILDYVLPKCGSTGWYYNELPFYWENCKVRLVYVSDYATYKFPINETFRATETPGIEPRNNFRFARVYADVDPDLDSVKFQGELKLSGQYSTMCRPKYLDGQTDPTVYPAYDRKFWEIGPSVTAGTAQVSEVKPVSPFEVQIQNVYRAGGVVSKNGNGGALNIGGWFPHIVPEGYDHPERFTAYYADFQGSELFHYTLRFPRPVIIADTGAVVKIETLLGMYELHVRQDNPNAVTVKSALRIQNSSVSAANYGEVWKLYRAVQRGNNYVLRFTE